MSKAGHDNPRGYTCANGHRLIIVAIIGLRDDECQPRSRQILLEILDLDTLPGVYLAGRLYIA